MELSYGADVLDSTHAFADFPEPGSRANEEDPTPSVHPNFNFELVVFKVSSTFEFHHTHLIIFQGRRNALQSSQERIPSFWDYL
jgi:hypothetical protein